MTRAEKRRLERENKALDKTITIKVRDLNKLVDDRAEEITRRAFTERLLPSVFKVFRRVMKDKFGFGEIRWDRVVTEVNKLFDFIYSEEVSFKDLDELEKEEKAV